MPRAYSYVRMSTDLQLKGDSRRRQLDASERFASEHGLELQEEFRLEDIGVSAFNGANVASGALGQFLSSVQAGKIPKGSYLLVESLDRLSRQDILASLGIFTGLLAAGIHIATLGDGHVYQAGHPDLSDLVISLVIMSRAHEESVTKSKRVGAAWQNKRTRIDDLKLTARCPAWLRLSKDRKAFQVDTERAETVREIFELAAAGLGAYSITKRLNATHRRSFGSSLGWQLSYVSKILESRAVIGEFQPHQMRMGKRVSIGEPIADYFPAVIPIDLFNRAIRSRAQRKVSGGGRRGPATSNLFSRVAKCGYCRGPMNFVNKGGGRTYLTCDRGRRGLQCEKALWPYSDFESSFLAFVREVDLEALVPNTDEENSRNKIREVLQAEKGNLDRLIIMRDRTYELVRDQTTPSDFIRQKLDQLEGQIADAENHCRRLERALSEKLAEAGRLYESKEQIKGLIDRAKDGKDERSALVRASVAARLKDLVAELTLFPSGLEPIGRKIIAEMEAAGEPSDVVEQLGNYLADQHRRCFAVRLKGGPTRVVYPDPSDPLHYLELAERSEKNLVVSFPGEEDIVDPGLDLHLSIILRSVGISD